jgi:hypothetical protein
VEADGDGAAQMSGGSVEADGDGVGQMSGGSVEADGDGAAQMSGGSVGLVRPLYRRAYPAPPLRLM